MPAYDTSLFSPPAPLARVTIRNQSNSNTVPDVPMLLDTGADVTLIPQSAINQLEINIDPNEGYELLDSPIVLPFANSQQCKCG